MLNLDSNGKWWFLVYGVCFILIIYNSQFVIMKKNQSERWCANSGSLKIN